MRGFGQAPRPEELPGGYRPAARVLDLGEVIQSVMHVLQLPSAREGELRHRVGGETVARDDVGEHILNSLPNCLCIPALPARAPRGDFRQVIAPVRQVTWLAGVPTNQGRPCGLALLAQGELPLL